MKNSYKLLFILVAFLLFPSFQPITRAQQANNPIVMQVSDHLAFYHLQADGQLTAIGTLPTTIGLYDHLDAEWLIPSYSYIVPSPDCQYIAFVASSNWQTHEFALFLYSMIDDNLKQVELPGLGFLHWSPDSDSIVISRNPYSATSIEGVYLYDLLSDRVATLWDGLTFGPILWTPDSEYIVYLGEIDSCESSCVSGRNLIAVRRTGLDRITLTNFREQLQQPTMGIYSVCNPSELVWNNRQHRIFYSLACGTVDDERRLDMVYSVSLNADNRLEAKLEPLFPNDTESIISDVIPVGNSVYVTVDGLAQPGISSIPDGYGAIRLLRIDQPQAVVIVQDQIFNVFLRRNMIQAELSPDQQHIAFIGYDVGRDAAGIHDGYVIVYDLSNGQIAAEKRTAEQVCSVEWVDNDHFVYTEFPESQCAPHSAPGNSYLFDLKTGEEQRINHPDSLLWVLLKP